MRFFLTLVGFALAAGLGVAILIGLLETSSLEASENNIAALWF